MIRRWRLWWRETGAALVLMHNRGRSRQMYQEAHYRSVVDEVAGELAERVAAAVAAGVPRERVIVDPGIGFAKQAAHSLELLARLPELAVWIGRCWSAHRASRF